MKTLLTLSFMVWFLFLAWTRKPSLPISTGRNAKRLRYRDDPKAWTKAMLLLTFAVLFSGSAMVYGLFKEFSQH